MIGWKASIRGVDWDIGMREWAVAVMMGISVWDEVIARGQDSGCPLVDKEVHQRCGVGYGGNEMSSGCNYVWLRKDWWSYLRLRMLTWPLVE